MSLTEAALQAAVVDLARTAGWLTYHTHDSRRSAAGFPDLVLVRGSRVVYAELKAAGKNLEPDQRVWKLALEAAGVEFYLWRPEDWAAGLVDAILLPRTRP